MSSDGDDSTFRTLDTRSERSWVMGPILVLAGAWVVLAVLVAFSGPAAHLSDDHD